MDLAIYLRNKLAHIDIFINPIVFVYIDIRIYGFNNLYT